MLYNLPIIAIVISSISMIISSFLRRDKWILASAALVLVNANSSPVNNITKNLGLGFGAAWFFFGLVCLVLILHYRIHPGKVLFTTPSLTGLFLCFLVLYFFIISPLVAYNQVATIRRAVSFFLVFLVGWRVMELVFRQRPYQVRSRLLAMLYAIGLWNIIIILSVLFVMAPSALRGEIGGISSQLIFAGKKVSRLQAPGVFPATALSTIAASTVFLLFHWLCKKSLSKFTRFILYFLVFTAFLILFWSAGRTAMAAFWVTSLVLIFMKYLTSRSKGKYLILLLVLGLFPILLQGFIIPLWMRGGVESSFINTFFSARLNSALEAFRFLKSYIIFGAGAGALDYTVESILGIEVESFLFQAILEFGLIGGIVYILVWVSFTLVAFRNDIHHLRKGEPAAWLPSIQLIFVWATTPASYGFGLFTGNLAILMAIAAAATVNWNNEKRNRTRYKLRFNTD